MTKKHFIAIADTIIAQRDIIDNDDALILVAQSFARMLAEHNSRFDYERFMKYVTSNL